LAFVSIMISSWRTRYAGLLGTRRGESCLEHGAPAPEGPHASIGETSTALISGLQVSP
jgi:hypothetical protein